MRPLSSTCLVAFLVAVTCAAAWFTGPSHLDLAPTTATARSRMPVRYIRVRNSTPSPAWSPNGRYLAYHDLAFAKTTAKAKLKRGTAARMHLLRMRRRLLRSTSQRGLFARLRRSTRARLTLLRRSTEARLLWGRWMRLKRASRSRRFLRRSSPNYATYFVDSTRKESRLFVVDTSTMKTRRYHAPRRIKRSTHARSAYFHPHWASNNLLLTSSSFGGDSVMMLMPGGSFKKVPGWSSASFDPSGRMAVGRVQQSGTFVFHIDRPKTRYAIVDERRKIRGAFARFSPSGKLLAWIDAGTTFDAAPLKLYSVTFTPETLKQEATMSVHDPWQHKKLHKAVQVKGLPGPKTPQVIEFVWAPDSKSIAYATGKYSGYGNYDYNSKGLYLYKVGAKKATLIDAAGANPSFHPNGDIYYNHNQGGLWHFSRKTGKRTRIFPTGIEPRVSPNGSHIAFLQWNPKRRDRNSKLFIGIMRLH